MKTCGKGRLFARRPRPGCAERRRRHRHGVSRCSCRDGSRCSASTPITRADGACWRASSGGSPSWPCRAQDRTIRVLDAASGEQTSFALDARAGAGGGALVELPDDRGPPRGPQLSRPAAGRGHRLGERPAAGRGHEQFQRADDRHFQGPGAGSTPWPSGRVRGAARQPEILAGYLATIENGQSFGSLAGDRGVGTFGGSEDHTAICCCRAGRAAGLCVLSGAAGASDSLSARLRAGRRRPAACWPRRRARRWPSTIGPRGWSRRCWSCGVRRPAATTARWPTPCGAIRAAADRLRRIVAERPHAAFDAAATCAAFRSVPGRKRAGSSRPRSRRWPKGRSTRSATLVDRVAASWPSELLENQVPQTIGLARSARQCGAAAASAFGAGFGGSVWALVGAARPPSSSTVGPPAIARSSRPRPRGRASSSAAQGRDWWKRRARARTHAILGRNGSRGCKQPPYAPFHHWPSRRRLSFRTATKAGRVFLPSGAHGYSMCNDIGAR